MYIYTFQLETIEILYSISSTEQLDPWLNASRKKLHFFLVEFCWSVWDILTPLYINELDICSWEKGLSRREGEYGNTDCQVFKRGIQNWKDFCLNINIPKGNGGTFSSSSNQFYAKPSLSQHDQCEFLTCCRLAFSTVFHYTFLAI